MAWNQKISKGFILTILLFFFISCNNQYVQRVALYESPLDSLYLTKQTIEKDTIQLNFDELKLSKSYLTDIDSLNNAQKFYKKENSLDTINHEYSTFYFPKPYLKSDSIINSIYRNSVNDSINLERKKLNLNVKYNKSLRDSVSLALNYLKELKASLNTKEKLDREKIKTELKYNQANLGLAKKYYSTQEPRPNLVSIKHHYYNKDTVFIKEINNYYTLKSNDSIRKVVYDTIKIRKTVLNNNITDNKLQRTISQKQSQINHLKDSLTLLNSKLLLANKTKLIDTIIVEKDKWYKEPIITPEPIVNTYIAYYSINKLNAKNIGGLLSKLKQIDLSKIEKVYLSGYTDATGSLVYNNSITTKRLDRIRKKIKTIGITESIIFSQNFAKRHASKSIIETDRRVEIKVLIKH